VAYNISIAEYSTWQTDYLALIFVLFFEAVVEVVKVCTPALDQPGPPEMSY